MTEPHLPGIPDLKQNTEGDAENDAERTLLFRTQETAPLLKTLTSVETESPRALRAWLSEELQRHNAALCKHLDEAFDRQLKSQRSAFERLAFQNGAHGVQSQTFSADLHADLRLAGLCLPPSAALEGLDAWQSQGDSEKGDAPVAVAPPPKLEKAVTEETKETKEAKEAKETKPAAPQAVLPWAAPPPGPGLEPPPILPAPETKDGSEGTSSINTLSQDDVANQDRRPSRMQEAWEEAQLEEKKRRASQVLGTTYNKLVTRIEIDFRESVVDAVVSFLVIFVLEIAWRLYMHKLKFLCDIFGVFDVLVVIATSIDVYVLQPFDAGYAQNFAVGRLTRIFRLMRIFRVLRVMRFAKNLQQLRLLGDVLSKCLSPLMWALLVLGIIMVGTGVLMSQLLLEYVLDTTQDLEKRQWVYEYYGTALKATYSVFEATFSGSWPLLARNMIRDVSEWYCIFWIAYQVVIGFAVMRVIGALFLNETIRAANSDGEAEVLRKMKEKEAFSQKVYQFFTAADASGDGRLSYEELETALQEPGVEAWLKALELEIHEAYTLFNLLDDDRDGEVSYEEFLHSALRLKGNARAIDSIMIMHEQAKIGDEIKKLRNMVVNSFAEASKIRERIQTAAESQIVANPFAHSTERRGSPFGDLLLSPSATKAKLAQRRASEVHIRKPMELT